MLVAREVATVDLLTEGRLQLGLGAVDMQSEYEQAGLDFDAGGTRAERLAEAVTFIKGLLNGEQVALAGRHYRVTGRAIYPLPVQRPPPPILIGGNGRSLLTLVAREADIVGYSRITFLPRWRGTGHFNRLKNGDVSLPCRVGSSNDPLTIPRLQRKAMRSLSTDLL